MEAGYFQLDIPEVDFKIFQKILLCVLQMTLRDEISQFGRQHSVNENDVNKLDHKECKTLEQKFAALFLPPQNEFYNKNYNSCTEFDNDEKISASYVFQRYF